MQTTPIESLPTEFFAAADRRADSPAIALTFDDGPHPDGTPAILDVLAAHGASATFFVLGRCAERWPELVRRIEQAGHLVANHTYDHPCLIGLSPAALARELWRCDRAVRAAGCRTDRLLRPPFGATDRTACVAAGFLGYRSVNWSVSGEDWRGDSADVVAARIIDEMRPGAIVLLHDGLEPQHGRVWTDAADDHVRRDRRPTIDALDTVLHEVRARGWSCVTLAALHGGRGGRQ